MKKICMTLITAALLMAVFSLIGCSEPGNDEKGTGTELAIQDISPAHYVEWTGTEDNKVYVVNSQAELDTYTEGINAEGINGLLLQGIDFSKYTLLLARGHSVKGIMDIDNSFFKTDVSYRLDSNIILNEADVAQKWSIALLVSKITVPEKIEFHVYYSGMYTILEDVSPDHYYDWQNMDKETVYVVNSAAELEKYLSGENPLPEIDFTDKSLLLMRGQSTNGIVSIENRLSARSATITLHTSISLNLTEVAEPWCVALLVNKIPEAKTVTANVKYTYVNYPREVTKEDISPEEYYEWKGTEPEKVYIVRSQEELQKYITGENPLPEIDFSKNTLLLARGTTPCGIIDVEKKVYGNEEDGNRMLHIIVKMNAATVIGQWSSAVLTQKIPAGETVDIWISHTW